MVYFSNDCLIRKDSNSFITPDFQHRKKRNFPDALKILRQTLGVFKKCFYLCTRKTEMQGAIAQLVEQRTENPCVPGSIPGGTTQISQASFSTLDFNLKSRVFYAHKSACRCFRAARVSADAAAARASLIAHQSTLVYTFVCPI